MRKTLKVLSEKLEFWQQLVITLIVGFIFLAITTSISIAFINNKSVKSQIIRQVSYLTELIARQSRLSLLYQSATSAKEIADMALQFPGVVAISIANEDGGVLYQDGVTVTAVAEKELNLGAVHYHENDQQLIFSAPVFTEPLDVSAWEIANMESDEQLSAEKIGAITLVYAKDSLQAIQSDIFRTNTSLSLLLAALLLAVVVFLTRRLTGPLKELSAVMVRAKDGESNLRTEPRGSKDIASMQQAFNTMMEAIELRDYQLRKARDEALQAGEVKSLFAANVSHELRTPMNSVLGLLDLLTYLGLTGKQLEYVETARQSATGLLELIDSILSYVHADSGDVVVDETATDLTVMVEEVVNPLSAQALRKRIDLGYTATPGLLPVWIDAQRVRQILTNLVGNAIKFTDRGEVAVSVSLDETDAGKQLLLRVRDTGVGIKPEHFQRIFEAFTQQDATTTRKYGGTGLGLAICRQYADLLGGEVSVRSEYLVGSEFTLTLPYKPVEPSALAKPAPVLSQLRVLVVDDATIVRAFIEYWVTSRQGLAESVADTTGLLAVLKQSRMAQLAFTHVFIDEQLPGVVLKDLVALLRNEDATRQAVITVLLNPWVIESQQSIEHCFFIEKPLTEAKLSHFLVGDSGHGFHPKGRVKGKIFSRNLNKKILVVDDNRANRLVAVAMLEQFGCDSDTAQNGHEAVDRLTRKAYDLVLMDCSMPVMDGYQASRAIRKLSNVFSDLPIVAMTANNSPEEHRRCIDAGMNDLLVKPLMMESLSALLQQYFATDQDAVADSRDSRQLNIATLGRLQDSIGEVFIAVVNAFVEDLPAYLAALRGAISGNSSQQVYELAHTIKGSAANVGAQVVTQLSRTLEEMGKSHDLRGAEAIFLDLEAAAVTVSAELCDYLRDMGYEPLQGAGGEEQAVVLVADDDHSMRLLFANALQGKNIRVLEATNGLSVVALCARSMPDIILLDALMPELDGFETCRKIRQLANGAEVPILMVTSLDDEKSINQAFSVGATDFITKPVNFSVLRQRVKRLLQTSRVEGHVRQLAYSDTLTRLPNRTAFNQQLRHKINRANLNDSRLALLFLDLDRFKMINDSLGHDAGDLVLKAVAERIRHSLRDTDLVARFGGDEFIIIIEDLKDRETAVQISEKICAALREPYRFLQQSMFVTASIGIAVYPDDADTMNTLLKHADIAMFRAKEEGLDYCFYEQGMEVEVAERLVMEQELHRALEQGDICFYYQPQVELSSGAVVGFESLVRWHHPTRGFLAATDFILVAEDSGLVKRFSQLAIKEGCELLEHWHRQGVELRLAINVAGDEFQQGALSEVTAQYLAVHDFPPHRLEVEITESMLMDHAEQAAAEIYRLRAQGLLVAIDDFGCGFSSLNYLKKFSVDVLKIDASFIQECHHDIKDQAIISGIITLAKSLNLLVVAEGVELLEQVEFLRSAGCDIAQGYYFGRPTSRADILAHIDSGDWLVKRAAEQ